MIIQLAQQ